MRASGRVARRVEGQRGIPVFASSPASVRTASLQNALLEMQGTAGNQSVLHSLRSHLQPRNHRDLEAEADRAAVSGARPPQLSSLKWPGGPIAAPLSDAGAGAALDSQIKKPMEAQLGADLSRVRIHSGASAAGMNRTLNSRAFAFDQSIYFGEGEYRPHTDQGNRLLAHELAHTVQQRSGDKAIMRQGKETPPQKPAIAAQAIIGSPQGSRVLLGRTMSDFIFGLVQSNAPDVAAALQVIDQQTATLATVNDDLVEVRLDKNVTIPARDKQPEVIYQNVTIKLERKSSGLFDFSVSGTPTDKAAPALAYQDPDLSARQEGGKFVLSAGTEPHLRISPGAGPTGTASIEAFTAPYLSQVPEKLRSFAPQSTDLVSLRKLPDAPAGSAVQQQEVQRAISEVAARRSSTGPRQTIAVGGGILSGARLDPLITASWSYRFRVSPKLNNLVQVPLEAEILYGPSSSVLGTLSSGAHFSLSDLKVPVNIRLITGFGGGTLTGSEPAGGGPRPEFHVAGPTLGGGVGYEKGWFRVDIRYEHLFNVIHGSPSADVAGLRLGAAF